MSSHDRAPRILGAAFLLQAITSLLSGVILQVALIMPGNISETMIRIANHPWLMRVNVFGEMITAIGVIFLGAVLYTTLRRENEILALAGFGFYILEAALLAASRIAALSLLRISHEYATAGHPTDLQTAGNLALASMNSGYQLLMLPFCLGAVLFYVLFYKSVIIPRALSIWGLGAVSLALIGTVCALAGHELSFAIYLPYLPFEFVVGIWILIRGGRARFNWAASKGAVLSPHENAGSDCRTLES
ncbi:MAG TPA: DUF4386 domain-containing protein [Dongiaceae bacterium]|nr:DUF4386 domain-containing protein [Dongiaceae bacterium]